MRIRILTRINFFLGQFRTDPAIGQWATTWMSGIALAVLVISLISGAIFALYWARKNKRNMKAAYPGKFMLHTLEWFIFSDFRQIIAAT